MESVRHSAEVVPENSPVGRLAATCESLASRVHACHKSDFGYFATTGPSALHRGYRTAEAGREEGVMNVGWVLPVIWVGLGVLIVTCSLRAGRSRGAYLVGVAAVSVLWVIAGAGANAYFLARGDSYSGFADGASTSFVRDTWESLVVPHQGLFIRLLIAFEAVAGALVLVQGRIRQTALLLLIAFNVALVSFGWGFLVWSVPLVLALSLLWRADRTWHPTESPTEHPTEHPTDSPPTTAPVP
jgi:hypothetical protein